MFRLVPLLFIFVSFAICRAQPLEIPQARDSYAALGQRLEDMIAQMDWGKGQVSFAVYEQDLPIKVLEVNASTPVLPGSTLALITGAAAWHTLGPGYKFPTELRMAGSIDNGTLNGDLIVRGGGDPTISPRYGSGSDDDLWPLFDAWAQLLRKRGVRTITGKVIGDARLFDDQWMAPGWPDELRGMGGLPSVSALNFAHNCMAVHWQPGKGDDTLAQYELIPFIDKYTYFASTVRIRTQPKVPRRFERVQQGNLITASGEIAPKTRQTDYAAIGDPGEFFAQAFKFRLGQKGIMVQGLAASSATSGTQLVNDGEALDVVFSPPLRDIVRFMWQHDSALEAEVLFKMLGVRSMQATEPGSFGNGARALEAWIDRRQNGNLQRMLSDGSGRSLLDRVSASDFISVLRPPALARPGDNPEASADSDALWDLLSQAGSDSLADRLADDRPAKLVRHPVFFWSKRALPRPPLPIWGFASDGPSATDGKKRASLVGRAKATNGHMLVFAFLVHESDAPVAGLRGQLDQLAIALTR